jgi:mono/diheme cytochrome c family protein
MFRRRTIPSLVVIVLLAVSGAAVVPYLHPLPATSVHKADLSASFDSDVRNVVCEWDPADPRPVLERRRALLAFTYQAYDSSAWVPESVLSGNWMTEALLGDRHTIARDRVGLVPWRENRTVVAFGMAPNLTPGQPLGWSVNCLACHTAEIDGVVYFGAGAKVLDEKVLADTVKMATSSTGRVRLPGGGADDRMAAYTHDVMRRHHHDRIDPLTRGRSAAFPASHVEMYVRGHGGVMPGTDAVGRGDVKTPPLWHTAAKRPFRRWYCDGSFHADLPLMASSMELKLDQSFDKLVIAVLPAIRNDFETVIRHLRPPKYPHPIDTALAERGKVLFHAPEVGCAGCHGEYDGRGGVRWTGLHTDVGTDRARLELVTDGFREAFDRSPLAVEGRLEKSAGYAATPLTGVWANYPYLHNGSVPTLHHLLGPVGERPRIFSVKAAGAFDPRRVGQRLSADGSVGRGSESRLLERFGNDRDWFNVNRTGCGNAGHDYWSRIRTDANREALIEYLKTL